MAYCYEYGIKMFTRGLLKEDDLKQASRKNEQKWPLLLRERRKEPPGR